MLHRIQIVSENRCRRWTEQPCNFMYSFQLSNQIFKRSDTNKPQSKNMCILFLSIREVARTKTFANILSNQVVQYWGTKFLCLTNSWRSCTILNTASGLASFSAFLDIVISSSCFGPNHWETMLAISFGDFENFPHPFWTTYGTFPASCNFGTKIWHEEDVTINLRATKYVWFSKFSSYKVYARVLLEESGRSVITCPAM